jgi:glycosyltransferase involved in cell wall biosynthesis
MVYGEAMPRLIFPGRIEENPGHVQSAELVVGIPSLNEADSIQLPTVNANEGLKRFFSEKKGVIINCDNASPDHTKEAFLQVPTETPKIYLSTPEGVSGKGNNLLNLFQRSLELGAKAIVVVDADVQSITPAWIRKLAEPLLSGYDFVAPVYVRHRHEWTVSNNIVYPMTRCLYGRRVREPMGGDFAISERLAKLLIREPREEYATGFGVNTWVTTLAVVSGLPICQSFLGGPRIHKAQDPPSHVLPVFSDNCGILFSLMEKYEDQWKHVRWSKPIPIFGLNEDPVPAPQEMQLSVQDPITNFQEGFLQFEDVWKQILHQDVFMKIWEIRDSSLDTFEFPHLLWALTLYDYAAAFRKETVPRETCLESLMPLYFGRVCSGARSTEDMDVREIEVYVEDQCRVFEETKAWLTRLWH